MSLHWSQAIELNLNVLRGRSHIVCCMVKFNWKRNMQLLIIVIDIFPIKITLKDIINQKELSHLSYPYLGFS